MSVSKRGAGEPTAHGALFTPRPTPRFPPRRASLRVGTLYRARVWSALRMTGGGASIAHACATIRHRMRIAIAPQEFKGTLSPREAAEAMARGARRAVAD